MKNAGRILLLIAIAIALIVNAYLYCTSHPSKSASMAKSPVNRIEYMR
jgi:hypothetical protein